jgi:hypothetical protein
MMCNVIAAISYFKILDRKYYTGRFIMYSEITNFYYRKTVGHVFTKPVQIEGTTQKKFPVSCFSS